MFEKNKIKKLFELYKTSGTFNIKDGANVKLKLKAYKRFLKELNNLANYEGLDHEKI